MAKNLVSGLILAHLAQIRAANFYLFIYLFFFKNLAPSVTRSHAQLSSRTISGKTDDPILGKLSDGRTDGRTDGQGDESNFIGRCPTNVERPIWRVVIKVGLLHLYSQKHRNTHEC